MSWLCLTKFADHLLETWRIVESSEKCNRATGGMAKDSLTWVPACTQNSQLDLIFESSKGVSGLRRRRGPIQERFEQKLLLHETCLSKNYLETLQMNERSIG
jgi:hypothetical protein